MVATRTITIAETLNVRDTVRGSKNPVMVGPTEVWWSTRTPIGLATMTMDRPRADRIEVEAWGRGADWMLDQAPRLLGHEDNLDGFEPTGKVRDMWRRAPFRLGRTDRMWDALIGAILGQKVQVKNAVRSRRRLARRFGEPAPGPRQGWILPGPDVVAGLGYYDLHPLGIERKRAEILIRTAREMPRLESLTEEMPSTVQSRLQRIRGIGPWTSAMVTAVVLGDPDAVPIGDYHIPNTVAWWLAGEPRATDERMLELLEPYRGHRWRVIRLTKGNGSAPKYGPRLSLTGDGMHRGR